MKPKNGQPVGTLREVLEIATIKEASNSENANEMVEIILNDFIEIANDIDTLLEIASEEKDEETGDLFLGIKATLEKNMWMLKAYLG
ncbi:Dps family protein [Bacillus sp. JJ722]|uniref:Dps family protein n=1 Tax=Bacillus sp. JJ722 TaxID=3122973 RepID=UPI002FFD5C70